MYLKENEAFIESVNTGVKNKSNIENVLETAKLLDALYVSSNNKKEVVF